MTFVYKRHDFLNCSGCGRLFNLAVEAELTNFVNHDCEEVPCSDTDLLPEECYCPVHGLKEEDRVDFPY